MNLRRIAPLLYLYRLMGEATVVRIVTDVQMVEFLRAVGYRAAARLGAALCRHGAANGR